MTANVVKLGQIATIDISNVDKKSKVGEAEVRLCNFVDVYHNWAITDNISQGFMVATANENQVVRFSVKKGMIAITKDSETRNDIGIPTYIADDFTDVVLGYHCALIKPDETILEGKYLNVVLHTEYAKRYFEANASGSGQRYTLTNEIIAGFPVPLPTIEEQRKIGNLFSTIDKKIENNNAICADLEGMAKLLYDYWFVQFDFPDENGKPYKSSGGKMVWNEEMKREIPEGWDVKALKGLYQIDRGLSYTSKDIETGVGVPMLNLACVDTSRNYRDGELKYHAGKVPDSAFVNAGDLMIACTDLTRERAIIGCPILVPDDGLRYTYSMDLAKISFPSSLLDEMYMYMTLRTEFYHNYIKEWASGTTVLHLNLRGIDWYNICIPPMSLQEKYATIMRDVHSKKSQILSENRDLVSLRDFLLPMLMNGQVKVKGA